MEMKRDLAIEVVLVEPEIPPNTGNIIRLCANTGSVLHLIEPLGFPLDSKRMRRAGLDYHEFAELQVHASWDAFLNSRNPPPEHCFALTTKGSINAYEANLRNGAILIFGSETKGLAPEIHAWFKDGHRVRLPMKAGSRSLNLSNSAAIMVYEAMRQQGFGDCS